MFDSTDIPMHRQKALGLFFLHTPLYVTRPTYSSFDKTLKESEDFFWKSSEMRIKASTQCITCSMVVLSSSNQLTVWLEMGGGRRITVQVLCCQILFHSKMKWYDWEANFAFLLYFLLNNNKEILSECIPCSTGAELSESYYTYGMWLFQRYIIHAVIGLLVKKAIILHVILNVPN